MNKEQLELYTDYLITTFGAATATDLSALAARCGRRRQWQKQGGIVAGLADDMEAVLQQGRHQPSHWCF